MEFCNSKRDNERHNDRGFTVLLTAAFFSGREDCRLVAECTSLRLRALCAQKVLTATPRFRRSRRIGVTTSGASFAFLFEEPWRVDRLKIAARCFLGLPFLVTLTVVS